MIMFTGLDLLISGTYSVSF